VLQCKAKTRAGLVWETSGNLEDAYCSFILHLASEEGQSEKISKTQQFP